MSLASCAINTFNATSKTSFVPGLDLSFGEDGVVSRSRMIPVWQCDKDKTNKLNIDFIALANHAKTNHFLCHLNIYQCQDAKNINIPPEIQSLPTMQKALVNALLLSCLIKDPTSYQRLLMDNRYISLQLLILLCKNQDI